MMNGHENNATEANGRKKIKKKNRIKTQVWNDSAVIEVKVGTY